MNSNFFTRLLEFIWLAIGIIGGIASMNAFVNQDSKNGWIMALVSIIGFLMFFARRSMRIQRRK